MTASSRPWRVKFDGPCAVCGVALVKGRVADWNRTTRKMLCLDCAGSAGASPPARDHTAPETASDETLDVGLAGGSARREYERRVAKREADVRARWGNRLGRVVLAVTSEPQSTRAWAIGAAGEERFAQLLADLDGVRVLNDRRVRGTRGNLDHIVIGPAGVFVVDAKNYHGMVEVRNAGGWFRSDYRLYVGRRDCTRLIEGMRWQIDATTAALKALGIQGLAPPTPVLCFIDADWPLFRRPESHGGVVLSTPRRLRQLVTEAEALDDAMVDRITSHLARTFPPK